MPDEITDAIESNATGPASASGDGQSVTQHSLADQILADKYLRSKSATDTHADRGLKFNKFVPPGTI